MVKPSAGIPVLGMNTHRDAAQHPVDSTLADRHPRGSPSVVKLASRLRREHATLSVAGRHGR